MGFLLILTLCLSLQAGSRLDGSRQDGSRPASESGEGFSDRESSTESAKIAPEAAATLPPPSKDISFPSKRIRGAKRLQRRFDQLKAAAANDPAALWRIQFEEARRISDRFCSNMKSLSLEKAFPLKNLAFVYFYEKCPLQKESGLSDALSRLPDWLQPFAARISYLRGKKEGDKQGVLNAAIHLGRLSRFEELRLSYQKHALKLAKELKDPRAGAIEEALFQAAPRLRKRPARKDWLAVADDWRKARRFQEARRRYLKILNSPDAGFREKNQAFKQTAWIYKHQKKTGRLLQWSRRHERFLNSLMSKEASAKDGKDKKKKSASAYKLYYKSRIQLAGRYWNLNQNKRALSLLNSVLQDGKASSVYEKAHYMKGLILIEEGRPEESLQEFTAAANNLKHISLQRREFQRRRTARRRSRRQARQGGEERLKAGLSEESEQKKSAEFLLWEKVLWQKAWILRRLDRLPEALKILKRLAAHGSAFKTRAAFWAGEVQRESGRRFASARAFHILRKEDPAGYYGLAASYRLGKPPLFSILSSSRKTGRSRGETASAAGRAASLLAQMESPERRQAAEASSAKAGRAPAKAKMKTKVSAGSALEDIHTVLWLKNLGEKEFLGDFLSFRQKKFALEKKSDNFEATAALFSLYHAAGRHLDVFQAFFLQKPFLQKQLIDNGYGGFLFPLNFQEETEAAAIKQKVSPALLFSLIRQESAFNPRARSRADAFGLMQLIPSTARAAARKLRMPYRGYRDLYDPHTNIPLGAAHFKKLLSRYKGSLILAAAAYNAGGTPVKKWTKTLDTSRPLTFIENIPWTETRVYIKLIIRNFIIYNKILRDLYAKEKRQAEKQAKKQAEREAAAQALTPPLLSSDEGEREKREKDRKELKRLLLSIYTPPLTKRLRAESAQRNLKPDKGRGKDTSGAKQGRGGDPAGSGAPFEKQTFNEFEKEQNKSGKPASFPIRFLKRLFSSKKSQKAETGALYFPKNLFFIAE